MELDADRLRVLVAVVQAGSIAEAARRLSFTPSALSQQLTRLEKDVGARVLERRPTGVVPTAVGAVLVEHGERVLGELRDAQVAVRQVLGQQPGRLAVGTFSSAGQMLVPSALAALEHRHPHAELSLVDLEPPLGYGLVASGELDVLITHRYTGVAARPHPGLERHRLLAEPLRLVLPIGHRLGDRSEARGIALAELADDTWVAGAPGVANRTCLLTVSAEAGFEPHVAYETTDYHVTLALVAAGLGVALVPQSVLPEADRRRTTIHRVRAARPSREISLLHRRRPDALTRELVELLQQSAAEL